MYHFNTLNIQTYIENLSYNWSMENELQKCEVVIANCAWCFE